MNFDLILLIITIIYVLVISILLYKSKWVENRLVSSVIIFTSLIYSGGIIVYGLQKHNFYCVFIAVILIYGSINKYLKINAKSVSK